MAIADDAMYRRKDDILADMLASLTSAVADAYVGEDGNFYIVFSIEAGQLENLYLANQLLLEDSFPTTATLAALRRYGDVYGIAMHDGSVSLGALTFSGGGGTYVPIGTQAAYDPGFGLDPVVFETTSDGTIPNPGDPAAPSVAINAVAGNLNGLYEYVITFMTSDTAETLPSPISAAVSPVNQQVNLTNIPTGGPGTLYRRIYRRKDGSGDFRRCGALANNTGTTFTDNATDAAVAADVLTPSVDTAHTITVNAQAVNSGVEGNVAAGAVTELTSAPSTLTDVTNQAPFTAGSDPEDTEDFRIRVLSALQNPQTGSPDDLKAWAENIDGVETATVFPNVPSAGSVTVRITADGGSVPSAALLTTVQDSLNSRDLANITVIAASFTPQATNVTVDVTPSGTYTLTDVTPMVQDAITDYINGLDIGETFMIAGVIDAVFGLPGIADVVVTSPGTNQTTASDTKRTPGTITVT